MSAPRPFNIDHARLPKVGAVVEITTGFEVMRGAYVGVVPGHDDAPAVKDRRPKLAVRTETMSATVPERDIRGVRVVKRAPRRKRE